jgi:hypothetical protein
LQASPFSPDRFGAMLCWLFDAIISFMPEHEEDYFASRSSVPPSAVHTGGNDWKHDRSRPSGGWHHLVHTHTHTNRPPPISWASGTLDRRPPNKRM